MCQEWTRAARDSIVLPTRRQSARACRNMTHEILSLLVLSRLLPYKTPRSTLWTALRSLPVTHRRQTYSAWQQAVWPRYHRVLLSASLDTPSDLYQSDRTPYRACRFRRHLVREAGRNTLVEVLRGMSSKQQTLRKPLRIRNSVWEKVSDGRSKKKLKNRNVSELEGADGMHKLHTL